MARRSVRSKKKKKKDVVLVAVTAACVLLLVFAMQAVKSAGVQSQPDTSFRIADYRSDGSRFASSGNRYLLEATVESIETSGNARIVCVSMKGQDKERLPLLVPNNKKLSINLTRNKTFLFDVSCRTGMDAQGRQVKGVLLVNDVTTK